MSEKIEGANTGEVGRKEEIEELQNSIGSLKYIATDYDNIGYFSTDEFRSLIESVESNLDDGGNIEKAKAQGKDALAQYIEMRKVELASAQKEIDGAQNLLSRLEKL